MEESKISFITKKRALTAPVSLQPPPKCCEYIYLHFQHRQGCSCYCRLYVSFLSRRSKVTSSERGSFLFLRTVIFPCSSSPRMRRKQKIRKTGTTFSWNSIHLSCEQCRGKNVIYCRAAAQNCWELQKRWRASCWSMHVLALLMIRTHYHCGWLYNQLRHANECLSRQQTGILCLSLPRCTARASSLEVSGESAEWGSCSGEASSKPPFLLLGQHKCYRVVTELMLYSRFASTLQREWVWHSWCKKPAPWITH